MIINHPVPVNPPSPPPAVTRFHKFGPYMICDICNLTVAYCKGHTLSDPLPPGEASAAASLEQRIRDAKARP